MSIFEMELKYAVWIAMIITAFILITWKKDNSQGNLTADLLTVIASILAGIAVILYFLATKMGATNIN